MPVTQYDPIYVMFSDIFGNRKQFVLCFCDKQITNMELKLVELRKGEVSTGDAQTSVLQRTQKAVRTLEYKLNKVSCEIHYHKITDSQLLSMYILIPFLFLHGIACDRMYLFGING